MTIKMLPLGRPGLKRVDAERVVRDRVKVVDHRGEPTTAAVLLLGVRGYYLDTMGEPGKNDRGIYDDALFVISPRLFQSFNANVDPSIYRKAMANLKNGVWSYKRGYHGISRGHPYPALVQAGPVTVRRDDGQDDTGYFGINIHRGSINSTSSEGCQTLHPSQWDDFINTVAREMSAANQGVLPYVLVDESALHA